MSSRFPVNLGVIFEHRKYKITWNNFYPLLTNDYFIFIKNSFHVFMNSWTHKVNSHSSCMFVLHMFAIFCWLFIVVKLAVFMYIYAGWQIYVESSCCGPLLAHWGKHKHLVTVQKQTTRLGDVIFPRATLIGGQI